MDREELNRSGLNSKSRLNFEYHLSMADCQNLGQFLKDVPNPWVKLGRVSGFHGIVRWSGCLAFLFRRFISGGARLFPET